jgi:hypothetical protein
MIFSQLPNGTKRVTGFVILVLPFVLPFFGYELADVAPVEMARFADQIVEFVGIAVLIYGTIVAKGPIWFLKKK